MASMGVNGLLRCVLGLLLAFGCLSLHADVGSREQALVALVSSDVAERREGAAALGQLGEMADAQALLAALYDNDLQVRKLAEASVWRVWSRSGDPRVDDLMQTGIGFMEQRQMGRAVDAFTRIIELRPDFAEGWNKRATAYYLMGDLDQSLKDCDQVMRRNPSHFGALSGYGLIYVQRGELERALGYFRRALAINPNLDAVRQSIDLIEYKLGEEGKRSI